LGARHVDAVTGTARQTSSGSLILGSIQLSVEVHIQLLPAQCRRSILKSILCMYLNQSYPNSIQTYQQASSETAVYEVAQNHLELVSSGAVLMLVPALSSLILY
jgi:hypothetical protein